MNKNTYKDLIVWQKSVDLCLVIYDVTKKFPPAEMYGLSSQMRRCAVSIPSNIAEGKLRGHQQEWLRFLRIAYGSGAELETQIEIARRVGFLDEKNYNKAHELLQEVMRMLNTMTSHSTPKAYRLISNA